MEKQTKQNVGGWDKNMRLVAGGALLAAALLPPVRSAWRIVALVLGATEVITGLTRYCPMNEAFGLNTATPKGEASPGRNLRPGEAAVAI